MGSQGFRNVAGNPFVYQEDTRSAAFGLDAAAQKWKLVVSSAVGALPTGTAQLTIDPDTNGDVTIDPNGAGNLVVTSGSVLATTFDTNVAAAAVTLSGTTLSADGTDADININITAKGTGKVIIDDLQLTTDLAVSEGGTGASTLTDHGVLLGSGTDAITPTAVGATGEVLIGNTGADASWSATPTVTTIYATTFDTNVAAAAVTLSGTTLSADGTNADININITAKGTGKVIIDDLQLTTDLAVTEGGTGASTLTSHGVLLGQGTSAISATAEGATGQTLMGTTGGNPGWTGSPSFSGSVTAGTSVTASNGNVAITSGNLALPTTTSTVGQITLNGYKILHTYGVALSADATSNIFVGKDAGNFTLTTANAKYNSAFGTLNLSALTTGEGNCAFGSTSLVSCTQGTYNIGFGLSTLYNLSTGSFNCGIGAGSLSALLTGSYNTAIGRAGAAGSGTAYTGAESSNLLFMNVGVVGESNKIRIGTSGSGNGQQNACYIAGIYGVTPGGTINLALVDSNGQLGSVASLGVAQGGTGAATLTDHGVLLGSGTGAITPTAVGATGEVLIGNTGADASWSSTPTVTTIYATTFDTNVAAAAVTLSGTTLSADGTDADININITAKGTGKVIIDDLQLTTDLAVSEGGTGASTLTDHGVLVGSGTDAITATAVGATGTILTGVTGADPTWTTATYPATAAIGDVLVASAANVIGVVSGAATAGYVLMANGAGTAPTFQANPGSGAIVTLAGDTGTATGTTVTIAGGTNLTSSAAAATVTINLDSTITLTTVNATTFDTNVAAAAVTLSGTTLSADGTDADININITAKGTGKVIIDDLQLTTDLAVSEGGTGASTLTDHGVLLGSGTDAITATAVGATGEVLIGTTGADASWSASPTLTSVLATTFDTNVAAAAVTLSGTTLSADGTDADININITAKGTGQVIIDDLQLTTDLAVTEGGTGASTLTDHGILLGSGTGAITPLGEASNGQLPIGSTGADPVLATLTAGTNITVTNGAGSITIASTALGINAQTDSYTLVIGDAGKLITMTKGTANTLTIPKNSSVAFAVGTQILVYQGGAGTTTVAPVDVDVTLRSSDSMVNLYGQYSTASIVKLATDTWVLSGDIA